MRWCFRRWKEGKTPWTFYAVTAATMLTWLTSAGSPGATGPLRLSGGFFQYWDDIYNWEPDAWHDVLDSMKAARMNTVIIQMMAVENQDGSIHSYISPDSQPDATETILSYADTNGFRVFLGLYMPNWNHDMLASNFLSQTQTRMASVAQQAWNRYLSGNRHPSFAGWYIPYEPWTADYQAAEVQRLRSFFQAIDSSCRAVSGDVPLAISPFISSFRPSPCRVELLYRQILDQSGIDIVLLQDSVGAQRWEKNIPQRVGPYFQAFHNACESVGARLWANLESFRISESVYAPCDIARLRKQFEGAAPYVEDFVTFDFVHYMNPVAFLDAWDQTRRDQMRTLYSDYKASFADKDFAPFARPALSANIVGETLLLNWEGTPGDSFRVQANSNLTDTGWTTLTGQITTNGSEFSFAEPLVTLAPNRWFRVQKLPRLQIPETMIYIPPGSFFMGTPTNDTNKTTYELARFQVTLTRGFWISQFEVTQSEYQNLMCANPASYIGDLECPADNLSWQKAMDYCSLLTTREREAMRLTDEYVYRLPTEAEWEYAARAGTMTWFSFGDDPAPLQSYGWYNANSAYTMHPVGQLEPNPWGLKDVHGNVFEWCWDWIGATPTVPVTDFRGATNGVYHAIRGGAYSFPWVNCRCSWRIGYSAASVPTGVGFRIVLAPE